MTGTGAQDIHVNQVLPGSSQPTFETIARNFGLTSTAFAALQSDLLRISPNLVLNSGASIEELRTLFAGLGLHDSCAVNSYGTQPFVFSFQNLSKQFPGPAHFYTKNIEKDRWVLPVPPANFAVAVPNSPTTVTTISGFNYTHAGAIELDEISFEGFFPYVDTTNLGNSPAPAFIPDYISYTGGGPYSYRVPRDWVERLVTAMRANQPLLFGIYATGSAGTVVQTSQGTIIEPTAMSVSSFDWDMGVSVGGTRQDVNYKMTLKRWRRQSICITNYVSNPNFTGGGTTNPNPSGGGSTPRLYTVRPGDYLIKIAQRELKNGHRWREIYDLNKTTLNNALKAHGQPINNPNLIYAGTVLKIPRT